MIDLVFTWQEVKEKKLDNTVVVVADVLRATTVMVTALTHGAQHILPQSDETIARSLYQEMKSRGEKVLICGERLGLKIEGFDLGNSPREFIPETVSNHTVIHLTTNGTRALNQVQAASQILIASFQNRLAVSKALLPSIQEKKDILLVASGRESFFCLEDTVCLGGITDYLLQQNVEAGYSDAAIASQNLYQNYKNDLPKAIQSFIHAQYLISVGLGDDLLVCAELDTSTLVPVMKNGIVSAL